MTEVRPWVSSRLSDLYRSRDNSKFRDEIKSFILSNADIWYAHESRLAGRLVTVLCINADKYGLEEYRKASDDEILALQGFGKRCLSLLRAALEGAKPADKIARTMPIEESRANRLAPPLPELPTGCEGYVLRRDRQTHHVATINDWNNRVVGYWSLSEAGDESVWDRREAFRHYCIEIDGRLLAISAENPSGPAFIETCKGPGLCALMDYLECWDEADLPAKAKEKLSEFQQYVNLLEHYAGK